MSKIVNGTPEGAATSGPLEPLSLYQGHMITYMMAKKCIPTNQTSLCPLFPCAIIARKIMIVLSPLGVNNNTTNILQYILLHDFI